MIRIALYSSIPEEMECICQLLTAYSIQHSWADCQVEILSGGGLLKDLQQTVDIFISDVSNSQAVEGLKQQKSKYPPLLVFPIAGPEVLPPVYVCPEIMPCGLFWRPISQNSAQPVIEQMMARIHNQSVPSSQDSFRISGKQKIQDVPFTEILFFEAREKRIALRMKAEELVFAGTLKQLGEELPPDFIRCHKSFFVNRRHILSVDRANASVILDNQMELPLSRSYKKAFLEVLCDEA